MSILTTGFVLTDNKDVFGVMQTINKTLTTMVLQHARDAIYRDETSSLPTIELTPECKYFRVFFQIKGETRNLSVHFDCDCDYSEYGDSKIIWSVNTWGMAEEIVGEICEVMKMYGDVYYCANDCVSDEFVKVGEGTTTGIISTLQ